MSDPVSPVVVPPSPVVVPPSPVKTVSFWAHLASIGLAALGVISTVSGALGGIALPGRWGPIVMGAGLVSTNILKLCGKPAPILNTPPVQS